MNLLSDSNRLLRDENDNLSTHVKELEVQIDTLNKTIKDKSAALAEYVNMCFDNRLACMHADIHTSMHAYTYVHTYIHIYKQLSILALQ